MKRSTIVAVMAAILVMFIAIPAGADCGACHDRTEMAAVPGFEAAPAPAVDEPMPEAARMFAREIHIDKSAISQRTEKDWPPVRCYRWTKGKLCDFRPEANQAFGTIFKRTL